MQIADLEIFSDQELASQLALSDRIDATLLDGGCRSIERPTWETIWRRPEGELAARSEIGLQVFQAYCPSPAALQSFRQLVRRLKFSD